MAEVLHELLALAAERHPDRAAIIGQDNELSYAVLHRNSRALANALIAAGVKPGSPVGLSIPKSPESVIAAYGIMMAGACYVPIDPFSLPARAVRIAKNVELQTLVTTADRVETLATEIAATNGPLTVLVPTTAPDNAPFDVRVRCWYDVTDSEPILPEVNGTRLAYILHTSGSTGLPKGVAISHGNALTFVNMAAEFFSVTHNDRLCSQAPLHFDLSVFDLYVACKSGAAIVLVPEFFSAFPKKMIESIGKYKITIWNSVASTLAMMMARGDPDAGSFNSMRLVLFSGDIMPVHCLRKIRQHMSDAELYNGYGQTEANTSACYKIEDIPNDAWKIPIGRSLPSYEVFALDTKGRAIERAGQEGELYVRSGAVAQGYWANAQATAERFVVDPRFPGDTTIVYRTGDNVQIDDNGDFLFAGRADDMIKSRGYRIELGEIDRILLSCPGVEAAAAVAVPDAVAGNRIEAFVSFAVGQDPSTVDVVSHIEAQLPSYMMPEEIVVISELPRTSTGKVDRKALLAMV